MLVEIARQSDARPVRILPILQIPRVGELQGRNGIGKTLSVKLLEFLTGQQPWAEEEEAWRTLRDRLGPTSITVSGLDKGQTLEWDLSPTLWPEAPSEQLNELSVESLAAKGIEMRIGGAPATFSEIQRVLRVHRLVGDETLEDSVRDQIQAMQRRVTAERDDLRSTSQIARGALEEGAAVLEPLSGRTVNRLKMRIEELEKEQVDALDQVQKKRTRASRLAIIDNKRRALDRLQELAARDEAGELKASLDAIDKEMGELRAERDRGFDAAVADVQMRQRVQEARDEVQRVEALLERAVTDVRDSAAGASVDVEGGLDPEVITRLHDSLEQEIADLREQQASQDAVPLVRQAAVGVRRALERVKPPALLDHPFAVLSEAKVTGRELTHGIDAEIAILNTTSRDPSGEQLELTISQTEGRLQAVVELQRALARERRHTSSLRNRRSELIELSGDATGDASERYVEIETRLSELEDRRRELQGSYLRYEILLDELGAGEDLARAGERLIRDMRAAGVVVAEDLEPTRLTVEKQVREVDYRLRQLEVELEEARGGLKTAIERSRLGGEAFTNTRLGEQLLQLGLDVGEELTETVAEDLLRSLERIIRSLNWLGAEAEGAVGAFAFLGDREVDKADSDRSRIDRVRGVAEQFIVEALNQPVLRRELFEDGLVEGYDHRRRVVSFRLETSPVAMSRALSAFSSGERVFAYTQMRLRAIPESEPPCENRVVVLDEFGAFLEARRIRALEALVQEELLDRGIDRVLFMLPLAPGVEVNDAGYTVIDRSAP